MPEIIRFSNDLCYLGTPLVPLRQYTSPRLTPIEVRFVRDGYREGTGQRAINRPEAAALAKSVIDCLSDPRYGGKSFGVICLQGHAQANVIENMLLEALGPAPFKDKSIRLLCGDPYSFQGDERDVIFLSMVAAVDGNARHAALTRDVFKQRFNVAVSRARDQLWLFHSIREAELSPTCMRRRLIRFCYSDDVANVPPPDAEYDSDFERDVAEDLCRAGYQLIAGYEIAGKRIDLVVADGRPRLAIECDGDHWHGPDQWEDDMVRQRTLERCGWHFIRVRASAFYADRPKAVRQLVEAIREYGIEPSFAAKDEAVARDWIREVSGDECLAQIQARAVEPEGETMVKQKAFLQDEPDDTSADVDGSTNAPRVEPEADVSSILDARNQSRSRSASTSRGKPNPPVPPMLPPAANGAPVLSEERMAVLAALRRPREPLGIPLLAMDRAIKTLRLSTQRLSEVVRDLVSENLALQR